MLPKIHNVGNPRRPIVSACNCPTSNISAYLDSVKAPLVRQLPSYVKDTNHPLQILEWFTFSGPNRYLFTMDIKSLYTVIPNNDGLQALKYHLNLRPLQHPPTDTLVRLAELVLNLNPFEFDNKHYQQVGGVAMGTKMGPNYACLFVGYVEKKMLEDYKGNKPQLYKRYIDDVLGASSGTRQDLENFMEFCSVYHPSLKYTFEINESSLSFLDLCLSISDARITTTIHYKPNDTHSYLDYSSSHPPHCKKAIPYGQFLCLRRICSDNDEYEAKSKEMVSFFENRGYLRSVVTDNQRRTQEISRERALGNSARGHRARCAEKIPLVLTYHPKNEEVKKILLKSFRILFDDPTNTEPLCVYRRNTSLRDILVHSTLSSRADDILATPAGSFPCHRPRCRTCDFTERSATVTNANGDVRLKGRFDCTAAGVVYVTTCQRSYKLYIGETGRRLSDRFGEHLRSVEGFKQKPRYQGGGFPVAEHFNLPERNHVQDMQVSVVRQVKGGTATQQREERRLIFQLGTLAPEGLNIDFKFL